MYDFDLQTGDTLIAHQDGSKNTRKVIGVGTVKLWDDVIRKTLSISCASNEIDPDTTTWIEGIGDIERLFWTKTYCAIEDANSVKRNVRCFLTNKQAIYSQPGLDDCYITAIDELNLEAIKVYPNPSNDELHFDIPEGQIISSILLYNILGQKVFTAELVRNNTLDVSEFSLGIYFGVLHLNDGSTKMFKCLIQ
jgi:hypothetical protein